MASRFLALLGLTTVAVTVAATPIVIRNSPVTLPIARRVNTTGVPSILKQDPLTTSTNLAFFTMSNMDMALDDVGISSSLGQNARRATDPC